MDCSISLQAAIQLTKQFTDNGPYYCWRVMSILVLVSEAIKSIIKFLCSVSGTHICS